MDNSVNFTKNNKIIIGFHGTVNCGKDTAALFFKQKFGSENTDIFALAGPLKDACKILFNFTDEQLYVQSKKEAIDERWNKRPREIMQYIGTEVLRNIYDKDFFIKHMKQRIDNSSAKYILISDVRYDNEAEFVRSLGGKVIKIVRPNWVATEHSNHASEQGISDHLVDETIVNDSTLEHYYDLLGKVSDKF